MTHSGYAAIPRAAIDRIHEIGPVAFAVLGVLAAHADRDGTCWPSLETIARIVGVSDRTVRTALRVLEAAQLIVAHRRRRDTTLYNVLPQDRKPASDQAIAQDRKPASDQGPILDRKPGTGQGPRPEKSDRLDRKLASGELTPENKHQEQEKIGPDFFAEKLVEKWNATPGIRHCQKMTANRQRAFKARVKEAGWVDQVDAALERVAASPFLTGENDRGWKADIDWFLRPDSMTKIMEGKYDGRPNGKPAASFRVPATKPYVFKASDSQ